jgi:hypothetical protein
MGLQESMGLMHVSCQAQIHSWKVLGRYIEPAARAAQVFVTWRDSIMSLRVRLEREDVSSGRF